MPEPAQIADALQAAYAGKHIIPLVSATPGFDLDAAYAVEAATTDRRRASGRRTVGVKVGYANKAVWRALKLETLVWAHMYDDTVSYAANRPSPLSLASLTSPKIEPEIVFRLKAPLPPGLTAAAVLSHVEWIALGFEIIDCVFADWKFQPADFVAAGGLHAGLVIGEPLPVAGAGEEALAALLASFTVSLAKNGAEVATGSGRNSLRSPALCLAELATAMAARAGGAGLAAGDLVSSGTLTEGQAIASGETWTATVAGMDLAPLSLTTA